MSVVDAVDVVVLLNVAMLVVDVVVLLNVAVLVVVVEVLLNVAVLIVVVVVLLNVAMLVMVVEVLLNVAVLVVVVVVLLNVAVLVVVVVVLLNVAMLVMVVVAVAEASHSAAEVAAGSLGVATTVASIAATVTAAITASVSTEFESASFGVVKCQNCQCQSHQADSCDFHCSISCVLKGFCWVLTPSANTGEFCYRKTEIWQCRQQLTVFSLLRGLWKPGYRIQSSHVNN